MKKSRISLFVAVLVAFCCAAPEVSAGGVYGTIYADSNTEANGTPIITGDSKLVATAIIRVYNSGGTKVGETTATVCGYYTVDLPSAWGTYTVKVINSGYYLRALGTCSSLAEYVYLDGERNVISFGSWYLLDIATF